MRIRETGWGPNITKKYCYSLIWFYTSDSFCRKRATHTAKYTQDVINSIKRK